MIQLLIILPFLLLLFIIIADYKIFFTLTIISALISGNLNNFSIICLIITIIKFLNRNKTNRTYTYRFYTNQDFENFNNQNYNHAYTQNSSYEYEKACEFFGVRPETDYEKKKKIYKEMAKKYHPDLNKDVDAEEMSKKINKNWDIIEKFEK